MKYLVPLLIFIIAAAASNAQSIPLNYCDESKSFAKKQLVVNYSNDTFVLINEESMSLESKTEMIEGLTYISRYECAGFTSDTNKLNELINGNSIIWSGQFYQQKTQILYTESGNDIILNIHTPNTNKQIVRFEKSTEAPGLIVNQILIFTSKDQTKMVVYMKKEKSKTAIVYFIDQNFSVTSSYNCASFKSDYNINDRLNKGNYNTLATLTNNGEFIYLSSNNNGVMSLITIDINNGLKHEQTLTLTDKKKKITGVLTLTNGNSYLLGVTEESDYPKIISSLVFWKIENSLINEKAAKISPIPISLAQQWSLKSQPQVIWHDNVSLIENNASGITITSTTRRQLLFNPFGTTAPSSNNDIIVIHCDLELDIMWGQLIRRTLFEPPFTKSKQIITSENYPIEYSQYAEENKLIFIYYSESDPKEISPRAKYKENTKKNPALWCTIISRSGVISHYMILRGVDSNDKFVTLAKEPVRKKDTMYWYCIVREGGFKYTLSWIEIPE